MLSSHFSGSNFEIKGTVSNNTFVDNVYIYNFEIIVVPVTWHNWSIMLSNDDTVEITDQIQKQLHVSFVQLKTYIGHWRLQYDKISSFKGKFSKMSTLEHLIRKV